MAIEAHIAAQCKGKEANYGSFATSDELLAEIAKADNFIPPLEHWAFATTAPVDARLRETARKLSLQRNKQSRFSVDVLGWEEIQALMAEYPDIIAEFYPEHSGSAERPTFHCCQTHANNGQSLWATKTRSYQSPFRGKMGENYLRR